MSDPTLKLDSLEGLEPQIKQRLNQIGIYTILDLTVKGPSELVSRADFTFDEAMVLCNKARSVLVEKGILDEDFVTARKIHNDRKKLNRLVTGSLNLDDLFMGGIETRAVTEFYGEFGTGKTQICHTLCVTAQDPIEDGGFDSSIIYIDTENTFRPERIVSIANSRGKDYNKVLDNIIVAKAYNAGHQELIMSELNNTLDKHNSKLLIIDSCIAHYRSEFIGRGTLAERQQRISKFMHSLVRIADTRNIAIVITNQVHSTPDTILGDPTKPIGGHVVAHTVTYRVKLRKAGKTRIARMIDSPYHAEREAIFVLNEKGIDDPEQLNL
ncbi:MAG: DNA repair and recombination protein RadA [Thermoproteota archaeon]